MDTCSIIMAVALYNTKDAQHTALLGLFLSQMKMKYLKMDSISCCFLCVSAYFADTSCKENTAKEFLLLY